MDTIESNEVDRVTRHLINEIRTIRKWYGWTDGPNDVIVPEQMASRIFREAFSRVGKWYAETYHVGE